MVEESNTEGWVIYLFVFTVQAIFCDMFNILRMSIGEGVIQKSKPVIRMVLTTVLHMFSSLVWKTDVLQIRKITVC